MTASKAPSSRAGTVWAWVPVLLLTAMLAGMGTLVSIAVDDPHFALEPNYYDKAVHWDRARAEANASQNLGLQLALSPSLPRAADGSVELRLDVSERGGAAFSGGIVTVEAFPNAYRNRVQRVTLREVTPGVYRGRLERAERGLWELRVSVERGSIRFHDALRRDVLAGAA